jgi:hypothetical protein
MICLQRQPCALCPMLFYTSPPAPYSMLERGYVGYVAQTYSYTDHPVPFALK